MIINQMIVPLWAWNYNSFSDELSDALDMGMIISFHDSLDTGINGSERPEMPVSTHGWQDHYG